MREVVIVLTFFLCLFQETKAQPTTNWQNKDLKTDGEFGISVNRAYNELLRGKRAVPVVVAVIDSGIDTSHSDLRSILWRNVDGSHGWNYLATEIGREDVTNLACAKKEFYDSLSYVLIPEVYRADYQVHLKMFDALKHKQKSMKDLVSELKRSKMILEGIEKRIKKDNPTLADFVQYEPGNEEEVPVLKMIKNRLPGYPDFKRMKFCEVDNLINLAQRHLNYGLREEDDNSKMFDGQILNNNDVSPDALGLVANTNLTAWHGTHVAGIIGGVRNNGIGIDGVADSVTIMTLKVVGNIRELRDENLAEAIKFAVDHGAKVVNMSFGKPYTWNKVAVDKAVKYAMEKDVLLVLAAGNDGHNLDNEPFYPNRAFEIGGEAQAWIEVGASGYKDDETLPAKFSNYGKKSVDVFAPGVQIYSTIPGSKYEYSSGTSMAAPVVTGLAALIREYYPNLTAVQVKEIIMKSVEKRDVLTDKCKSGGVVNAFSALELAGAYK